MFLHLSVIHSVHGGEYLTRYTPLEQTLPGPGTPPEQTPPWTKYTPPGPGTPPRTRYTITSPHPQPPGPGRPPTQVHPPGPGTPPMEQSRLGDTVNVRAVRILLECNLVYILCSQSTLILFMLL